MRVLISQFKNESNTFNECIIKSPAHVHFGRDAELALFCSHNELNGFASAIKQHGIDDTMMSVCVDYPNGGIMADDTFRSIVSSVKSDITSFKPDVILFAMNGATVTESEEDACGAFLEEVRKTGGSSCVIGVTVDMHANLTERMVNAADIVLSYKTTPHTDLFETGKRTAELAILTAKKQIHPHTAMIKLPLIIPAEMGATEQFPMRGVMKKVAGIENRQGVYCASATIVAPWLDVRDIGCAVVVCADSVDVAKKYATEVASFIWDMRNNAIPEIKSIADGVKMARRPKDLPVLFVDSADSPAGGSYGDSAEVLRGLLEHAQGLKCVTNVADPAAARLACTLGEGADIEVAIGGWSGSENIKPVPFKGKVAKICGGMFVFKGAVMNGKIINMGLTALLEKDGIFVLVTENAVDNRDPEMYRSAGIVIEEMDIVTVKSAVGYTIPYCGLYCERMILDTPGAANPRLQAKDYKKLKRVTFPFDSNVEFKVSENNIFIK